MTEADLDKILIIESERDDAHWSRVQFEQELAPGKKSVPLVAVDDEVVGFAIGRSLEIEFELFLIVVAQNAQRKGIGKTLLAAQIEAAQETGAETLFLEVKESNGAAQELYKNAGFIECGRRKKYYANGETAVLMQFKI